LEKWRILFGFAILFVIAALACVIGLGKVEKESSYGLEIILGCLSTLSGGFAAWAFGATTRKE
jgi:hypothetical protein